MGRFISLHWLACVLVLIFHHKVACSSSPSLNTNFSSSSAHRCSHEESSALFQFKKTFIINSYNASLRCGNYEGVSSPKPKYWKVGSDCCSWDAVTCDEVSGHVTKLDLSCSLLQGVIHSNSSLFQLPHLQSLNLAFNNFMGSQISSEFGQFSDLTHLNLSNSNFSGEIPLEISNLSKLVSLDLSIGFSQVQNIHLNNFDILLQQLPQLQKLVFDGIDLSFSNPFKSYVEKNLSSYPSFSYSLTYLSLKSCQLVKFPEDFFHYPHFRRLIYLDLSGCNSLGRVPKGLGNLTKLTHLDISSSGLRGQLSSVSFSNLEQLELLDLSQNQLEGQIPNSLANLTKLTHLDFSSNDLSGQVSSTVFSNLKQLEFIDLSWNHLEGQILNSLADLKKLKVLKLDRNNFTGGFPSSFANLSQLNTLSISYNHFTGNIPADTSGSQLLSVMDLSSNSFKGPIPSWLFTQPSLVTLNLGDNQLSGEIPPHIGNLLNLTQLILSSNLIGGMIPRSLFSHPSLETIDLSDNLLFGPIASNITGLQKLTSLGLSNNNLNGTIPSALLALPSLIFFHLRNNNLTGHVGEFKSTLLRGIDLGNNTLQGFNFSSISNLVNLNYLDLNDNNLTGTLELDVFSRLQKLRFVHLFHNKHLSLNSSNKVDSPLPELTELRMASCNLSTFPFYLRNLVRLQYLDLSNNKIDGSLPEWLGDVGKSSLLYLNLSHNFLTSSVEILPWGNLTHLDLSFNLLQGALPVPSVTTKLYFISNNKLGGKIHPRICDLSELELVNFSNNSFIGNIPDCLFKIKTLSVLNIRGNNLSGTIPEMVGGELTTLDLSHNQLVGHIPRSLANCTSLEILDLGYNLVYDTFPNWLETLPKLKILVLRSNRFYGYLAKPRNASSFTKLNVIDLSYNNFLGNLPSHYFYRWMSMMVSGEGAYNHRSKITNKGIYYSDSVTLTNKGQQMELGRILTIFKAVDFSHNKFEGVIPESIGNLKSLIVLNLSSNGLTGNIPTSMGNLNQLQSLDFSNNRFFGSIPKQLDNLTFLGAFNVSQNNLEGQIPQTGQLSTFPYESYKGNPSLCGIPLPRKCEKVPMPQPIPSFEQDKNSEIILDGFTWKPVVIGYGCGAIVGTIVGNVIIRRNEEWFLKIFNIRL